MSRNPLRNRGAEVIGEMIVKGNNNILEGLNITECEITAPGAVAIYKGLKKAGSLRRLILDNNILTASAYTELSHALWMNYSLEKLSL